MNRLPLLFAVTLLLLLIPIGASGQAGDQSVFSASGRRLKGNIEESPDAIVQAQDRALGFTSKKEDGKPVIDNVIMGSSAWYQGLRRGDKIINRTLAERPDGLTGTVTFERHEQQYQAVLTARGDYHRFIGQPDSDSTEQTGGQNDQHRRPPVMDIAAPPSFAQRQMAITIPERQESQNGMLDPSDFAAPAPAAQKAQVDDFVMNIPLSSQERVRQTFQGRDLVVLIDRSGSMATTDCPGAISRWDWCKTQTMALSQDVSSVFPRGFSLVLFNNHQNVTNNADVGAIQEAFQKFKPDGGTDTAQAVTQQLKAHAQEQTDGGAAKPLVLIIITDGAPNDPNKLRNVLITVANDSTTPNDVSVVFVEVGEDNQATGYLDDLSRNLNQEGAKFNIVHSVLFDQVMRRGLLPSVEDALAPAWQPQMQSRRGWMEQLFDKF